MAEPIVIAPPHLELADRPAWLALRRTGIGGSDAAAIAGLDPWRGAYEVYLDKIGELPEQEQNDAMRWGHLLERTVADAFTVETGVLTRPSPGMMRHPEREHMLANIDRLAYDELFGAELGVYEGKTTGAWSAGDWKDDVPDRVAIQMQHYLSVTGYRWGWVAVLIGGQKLLCTRIERDEDAIESLHQLEDDFWQRVIERRPPPVDGLSNTTAMLARQYQVDPGKTVVLDPDAARLLSIRAHWKAVEKDAKSKSAELENRIKVMMGEAELGLLDGEVVCTWKQYPATESKKAYRKFETPRGN